MKYQILCQIKPQRNNNIVVTGFYFLNIITEFITHQLTQKICKLNNFYNKLIDKNFHSNVILSASRLTESNNSVDM